MSGRQRKSGGNSRAVGALGEALLNAGLSLPDLASGDDSSASLRRNRQPQAPPEGNEGKSEGKTGKQKKAKGRKQSKKRKNSKLLRIVERQKQRKKSDQTIVPSIMGDDVQEPGSKPLEDKYSVRRVQEKLKILARQLQQKSLGPTAHDFDVSKKEIARRLADFDNIKSLVQDIDTAERKLVLGFDLGSTSSKLVLRFPYEEGLGAYAVPAPEELCAEEHPYYWQTQLWQRTDGLFELQGSRDARLLNHLKVAFLNATAVNSSDVVAEDFHVCAYMALMMRQALGWLWQELGSALQTKSLSVSVNFGFPTESGGKSLEQDRFQACGEAAVTLALSDAEICDTAVRKALADRRQENPSSSVQVLVVPEFIGAVMGYFHSAQRHNGQFMICDFGGLTIDSVCFGFFQREDGVALVKIYGSKVEAFGAEVAKLAVEQGTPQSKLKTAIGSFICDPVRDAYQKTGHGAQTWGGQTPLFVIGGGRHCGDYDGVFGEAEWLMRNGTFNTKFRPQNLDLDEELDVSLAKGRSCGRLLVAWGLSHSDLDLPEWLTRGEIADAPKLKKRRVDDLYVGKEQT